MSRRAHLLLFGHVQAAVYQSGVSCFCRYDDTGQLYYNLEYTVKSPDFFRHNISVYAARYVWVCTCKVACSPLCLCFTV